MSTSTELEVYEPDAEMEEYTPLTERQAKALDNKIRTATDKISTSREQLVELLDKAAKGQIHIALGKRSWTEWFSESVQIRALDVADRKELVKMMSSIGMSQRAAAKTLGISQSTARRDLEGESFDSDTVTTLDGKTAPRNKAAKDVIDAKAVEEPEVEPESEPLRPVSDDFQDEMWNLANTVTMFKDILENDARVNVQRTRNSLAKKHINDLTDAIKELQTVVDFLMA